MDEMLRKIDEIRDRLQVSYATARDALEKNNGSLVEAIVWLEDQESFPEKPLLTGAKAAWDDVQVDLKGAMSKARSAKIRVLKGGRPVAEIPAAMGMLGLAGLAIPGVAILGAIGSVTAMMHKYTLDIKEESEPVNKRCQDNIDNLK